MIKMKLVLGYGIFILLASLASCRDAAIPKPAGYFRIDLPEHSYTRFNSDCDMSLDVPNYARVENFKDRQGTDSCWFNISYPRFNAILYCTYFKVVERKNFGSKFNSFLSNEFRRNRLAYLTVVATEFATDQ